MILNVIEIFIGIYFICDLPCDDVRGSVDDFIAGLGGFESAKIIKICLLVQLESKMGLLFNYSRGGREDVWRILVLLLPRTPYESRRAKPPSLCCRSGG